MSHGSSAPPSTRPVARRKADPGRRQLLVASLMVVFGSFMFEELREIKLFGLGLALAVLLDATLVRMLLVPATMELLGSRNWWLPRWLDRLLPEVGVH